jgi:hypothetical protein
MLTALVLGLTTFAAGFAPIASATGKGSATPPNAVADVMPDIGAAGAGASDSSRSRSVANAPHSHAHRVVREVFYP